MADMSAARWGSVPNLHPSGFDEIMPKTLATATVDQLLHHAHVVITKAIASAWPRLPQAKGLSR